MTQPDVPGPGEPDPRHGGGGGVCRGDPTEAWGQYSIGGGVTVKSRASIRELAMPQ